MTTPWLTSDNTVTNRTPLRGNVARQSGKAARHNSLHTHPLRKKHQLKTTDNISHPTKKTSMDLVRLIQHPELMNKETLYELRSLVALYPYYQSARLLMLQNMYLLHDSAFDEEIRRAALYVTDRKVLFELVESKHYKIKTAAETTAEAKEATDTRRNDNNRTLNIIDCYLKSNPDEDDDKPQKRKPTPADAAVDYVAYLINSENDDNGNDSRNEPQLKGQELIDDFINKDGGKLKLQDNPEYKPDINNPQDDQEEGDESCFTETLAQIYIKQGRYSKALEIIQRLNLNYPKKNAYFADQIRFLKKLITNEKAKARQNGEDTTAP